MNAERGMGLGACFGSGEFTLMDRIAFGGLGVVESINNAGN